MWIILALGVLVLVLLGYSTYLRHLVAYYKNEEQQQWTMAQSNMKYRQMLVHWIEQKNVKKKISDYLRKRGMKRIAVYGMSEIGEFLCQELSDEDITVVCGIDRNKVLYNRKVVKPEDFQEEVDAIIVTPIYYFSEIYDGLTSSVKETPILGLDEIIFDLYEDQ